MANHACLQCYIIMQETYTSRGIHKAFLLLTCAHLELQNLLVKISVKFISCTSFSHLDSLSKTSVPYTLYLDD